MIALHARQIMKRNQKKMKMKYHTMICMIVVVGSFTVPTQTLSL